MATPISTVPPCIGEMQETTTAAREKSALGTHFLTNMWYYALASEQLKRGTTQAKIMLGEPILIGRDRQGKLFAFSDICPHQGVPLSAGSFDGKEIECPFHGWRFDTTGSCTAIPALVDGQQFNLCAVKTKSFPCTEVQGNVWVYFGERTENLPEVPAAPRLDESFWARTHTTLIVPSHFDYHAVALLDPSHVPYVHKQWWWSRSGRSVKEKSKAYVPAGTGFTMVQHKRPSQSFLFKLFGSDMQTEIGFRLPAYRMEHVIVGSRTLLSGITVLTPIDENTTEFTHITYWNGPLLHLTAPLVRPFIDYFVKQFVSQDQAIAIKQASRLCYKPNLIMTIKDSGTPGRWYFQLKREWMEATEQRRPFKNPLKETVLHWRT